jgi:hypothetical protein
MGSDKVALFQYAFFTQTFKLSIVYNAYEVLFIMRMDHFSLFNFSMHFI